jgi:hypothetical protein
VSDSLLGAIIAVATAIVGGVAAWRIIIFFLRNSTGSSSSISKADMRFPGGALTADYEVMAEEEITVTERGGAKIHVKVKGPAGILGDLAQDALERGAKVFSGLGSDTAQQSLPRGNSAQIEVVEVVEDVKE